MLVQLKAQLRVGLAHLGQARTRVPLAAPEVIVTKPKAEDDPEKRIEDLKRRAEELCGGQMEVGSLDDCPAETEEAFWQQVVDYEEAP